MAALAVFALTLLARDAAGLDAPRRRLPLRRLLLRYSAACTVLGASAIIHAVAAAAAAATSAIGLPAVGGRDRAATARVHGRTLPRGVTSRGSGRGGSRRGLLLVGAERDTCLTAAACSAHESLCVARMLCTLSFKSSCVFIFHLIFLC